MALHTALSVPISSYESYEVTRGRQENRHVSLYDNGDNIPDGWNGIKRLIKVRRWGTRHGIPYDYTSYYITSRQFDHAKEVAGHIRRHWGIENNLHWIKDALMGEDDMTIKQQHSATCVAFLNTLAMNLLNLIGHKPCADTFVLFSNNFNELNKVLAFFGVKT